MSKSYTIKYDVYCKLENFFGKEIIVKNCVSEIHAKFKLDDFCKKKYGIEFDYLIISSCNEKSVFDISNEIFGKNFGDINNLFGGSK